MKSNFFFLLQIVLLVLYLRNHCLIQGSKDFLLFFLPEVVWLQASHFRSAIYIQSIFMYSLRCRSKFLFSFAYGQYIVLHPHLWEIPTKLSALLKSIHHICVDLSSFLDPLFHTIDQFVYKDVNITYLDYCNFMISLETRKCKVCSSFGKNWLFQGHLISIQIVWILSGIY